MSRLISGLPGRFDGLDSIRRVTAGGAFLGCKGSEFSKRSDGFSRLESFPRTSKLPGSLDPKAFELSLILGNLRAVLGDAYRGASGSLPIFVVRSLLRWVISDLGSARVGIP